MQRLLCSGILSFRFNKRHKKGLPLSIRVLSEYWRQKLKDLEKRIAFFCQEQRNQALPSHIGSKSKSYRQEISNYKDRLVDLNRIIITYLMSSNLPCTLYPLKDNLNLPSNILISNKMREEIIFTNLNHLKDFLSQDHKHKEKALISLIQFLYHPKLEGLILTARVI